ncbi:MAG: LacI family DNA-binding transcriptional regulator [Spirochaetia bacterium]|nr:LacI family DNA-binding transcriptional regulator [Spirochaetia bacterium]MDD7269262.1 LacI family DNA-binding transcriptional regulator [Treponema sp.]MDY4985775.1 LacI family DNA-binding transcriptional regulator [Treponema sp.]
MDQKKKVRLSDIADRLNISTVTVSKALANKDGVGDDLRKQIKALAEEMGYKTKNTAGVSENGKLTGNIGILIPSRFFSKDYSFYWYLFNHLSSELLNRNYYSIMELLSTEDEQNIILPRMLNDKKVDGIIILGQVSTNYIEAIHSHFDNFILMDFYTNQMSLDCVSNDDYYCSYMLTSYVISQGHKNIRFVGNFNATTSIRDRYMGFQKAMLENNIETTLKDIIDDRDPVSGKITIQLPQDNMPTAFVCNCDLTAATVIDELTALGYKVPDDISVTGFDNYLSPDRISIPLTTVYIKPEDTASVAADLIIKKINGEPYIHGRHLVSGSIVIRDSVKKIN